MGTLKLTKAQETLLKRIRRCPKGCYVEIRERKTAGKLVAAGLITLNRPFNIATPVEGRGERG
jgi:hypothetical protein